jgi:hypothetical protein
MTMQHPTHPDDERLAALAGRDPDATADAALVAHARDCARCGAIVEDLRRLRTALADLPDLPPGRPLQLVPPVAERTAPGGALGWLRRLAAPAMAAGAGLALVGAVGFGSVALGGMAASAGGAPEPNAAGDRDTEGPETASSAPAYVNDPSALPQPGSEDGEAGDEAAVPLTIDFGGPAPWLALIGGGVALLVAGLVLRFAIQPRAG